MLAAHRRGGRTDFLTSPRLGSLHRARTAAASRTPRELRILIAQLEASLALEDGELAGLGARELRARRPAWPRRDRTRDATARSSSGAHVVAQRARRAAQRASPSCV